MKERKKKKNEINETLDDRASCLLVARFIFSNEADIAPINRLNAVLDAFFPRELGG